MRKLTSFFKWFFEPLYIALTGYMGRSGLILWIGGPMLSTDFRAVVEPILNEVFDGVYDQRDDEYAEVFVERAGTPRAYHEEPVLYGFPTAPLVPDGEPVAYFRGGTLWIQRYPYFQYGMAFALTKVLVEDGDHIRMGKTFSEHSAQSLVETKETLTSNVLNRAFNASYPGGDGVALCSTAHPIANGATFSNQLSTPAALSQTSLEQMLIQIRTNGVDNTNKKVKFKPRKIVCAPQNEFQAEVLVRSVLRAGTMNNDVNPVRSKGILKEDVAVLTRLTSGTAWWILNDVPGGSKGLQVLTRRKVSKSMEGDFDTDSMRYKIMERYAVGFTDPRYVFGTAGV